MITATVTSVVVVGRLECKATTMSNQARVSNGLLWVFIVLYVLIGASRLLHNPHLQRLMPFISVAYSWALPSCMGSVDTGGDTLSSFLSSPSSSVGVTRP